MNFNLPNEDLANRSLYYLLRLTTGRTVSEGNEWAGRFDLSYGAPFLIFSKLDAGVRISRRTVRSDGFSVATNCSTPGAVRCFGTKASAIPGLMTVTPGGFFDGVRPFPRSWAVP